MGRLGHTERIETEFGAPLAKVLKLLLEQLGTQGAVASRLGVSQAWVSRQMYRCGLVRQFTFYAVSDANQEWEREELESVGVAAVQEGKNG